MIVVSLYWTLSWGTKILFFRGMKIFFCQNVVCKKLNDIHWAATSGYLYLYINMIKFILIIFFGFKQYNVGSNFL